MGKHSDPQSRPAGFKGGHREFKHKDVKGETNPAKIKETIDRAEAENQAARDRIMGW